ncbi:MAG: hypothetical protein HZB21_07590, partial [Deltaproteobacteria bacterium]|nr:hypothetical protein [Deltaproteobacteria bacterium]
MAGRIIFTLMIFLCALTSASGAADIEALKEPLKTASSKTEEALIYKKTGDYYSSQGGFKNAADPYIKALALDRQRFSIDERMKMAVFISWGGRLDKAE